MSTFNDGIEAAAEEIDAHAQAHRRLAQQYGAERPGVAETMEAIAHDLKALARKVRRLKR